MAFWTEVKSEPTRKYRFLINADGPGNLNGNWWWAKSVSKPSYEISTNQYQLGNHFVNFPGTLKWQPIELNIVDVSNKTKDLYTNLIEMGYTIPTDKQGGIEKKSQTSIKQMNIQQLDGAGKLLENWVIYNAFISQIRFGDLNYESDELVDLSITLIYDYAELA